jgi:hypothetical protein
MGKPKKRTSSRRTGSRRSHLLLKLARAVNAKSPIKVRTTKRETGKKLAAESKPAKPTTTTKKATAKAKSKATKSAKKAA